MSIHKTIFTVEVIHNQREGEKLRPDDLAILLDENDVSSLNTITIDSSKDWGTPKKIFINVVSYGKDKIFYVNLVGEKKSGATKFHPYATDQLWLALSRVAILQEITGIQMEPFLPCSLVSVAEINDAIDKVGNYHDPQFVKVTQEDYAD